VQPIAAAGWLLYTLPKLKSNRQFSDCLHGRGKRVVHDSQLLDFSLKNSKTLFEIGIGVHAARMLLSYDLKYPTLELLPKPG
jgi:hypothetical protein